MMNIWSCEKCLRAWNRCICEKPERVSDTAGDSPSNSSQVAGYLKMTVADLAELYGSAYQCGHHDTVEAQFKDAHPSNYVEEFEEEVAEWLSER